MQQKMIKLKRPLNTKYEVDYPLPNGTRLHYEWRPATDRFEHVVEVPEEVFEHLKYNTFVFQKGKLVVVEDEIKEEIEYLMEDAKPVYSVKEVKGYLEGTDKKFKEFLEKIKDDADTLAYVCSVAIDIKLDSARKMKLLADAKGVPVEMVFPTED